MSDESYALLQMTKRIAELKAENERLRDALKEINDYDFGMFSADGLLCQEIASAALEDKA